MKSNNTWLWFVVATILFAFIFFFERHLHPSATLPASILPQLQIPAVTSVQIIPAGALEIRADRTNNAWRLTKPISYPAQTAAIEALLAALQKLKPVTRIGAAELHDRNPETEFGFEIPQISLVVEADDRRWQLLVGNKTAPGDQVFLRLVGMDGTFVANADWLKFIPQSVNNWRNTALVDAGNNVFDSVVLTNGAKVIELHRDLTNHFWRMVRPLQARADSERITGALQLLQTASVTQFVTDDARADLTGYGLQSADLDLWLGYDTNIFAAVHVGKSPTNDPTQVFARREGWNAVFTTAKDPLLPWHGSVNDFRDPHLLELAAPVAEIEVRGQNNFVLQQEGSNDWHIAGEKFPVDVESVQQFIKLLTSLRVAEFVKDVVTAPDLPVYGLATPSRQITLRSAIGDSNAVIAQLSFAAQTNGIFVRRTDEDFIYAITAEDFNRLPEAGWEFRNRRIWNFTEEDVAQIVLQQNGKTRTLIHNGPNKWSLAPGSQGIINPPAIEETVHRFGELTTDGWIARNLTGPEKFGFKPDNLQIVFELKTGEKFSVDFGAPISDQTALAAVTLDGERWAFVFPPVLYQFVLNYLTIPMNVP